MSFGKSIDVLESGQRARALVAGNDVRVNRSMCLGCPDVPVATFGVFLRGLLVSGCMGAEIDLGNS
jgi:hypothetical protein